jgi:hypothetical protein
MGPRPTAYWLFVCVGFAQLGVLAVIGESTITARGLVPVVLMVAWLGRRSRAAWLIFVALNAIALLATGALVLSSATGAPPGGGVLWGDTMTILIGAAALLLILLSRPMRSWMSATRAAA